MNMRAFLKGDSKPLSASSELEKYSNVPAFAAPKRTYYKPTNSSSKSSRKILDENQNPTDDSFARTQRLDGISDISHHSRQGRALEDLYPANTTLNTENKRDRKEGGEIGPQSLKKTEKAQQDLSFRLDSVETATEGHSKRGKQEHDVMIVSLIEEIDRLNGLLLEKITENEKLKLINVSLEMRIIDLEGLPRQKSVSKSSIDHSIMDSKGKFITHETMNSEEDSKYFEEGTSTVQTVQGNTRSAPVQQPKWNSSRKIGATGNINGNGVQKNSNREKKGAAADDKAKVEELLKSVDALNQSVNEKERENSTLYDEVEQLRKGYEAVGQKLLQQQQVTEKLRSELVNAHAQNHELNQKLMAVKGNSGNSKVTTISFSRVDSSKANFSHQEMSEWQKKYEFTKNDNDRLIKIIEENHKTIQNFKDIFRELENRHNITHGELKREYESLVKGIGESRSGSRANLGNGRGEHLATFSGVSNPGNTSYMTRSSRDMLEVNKVDM